MSSIDDRRDERYDDAARRVLADPQLGRLVRVACGIVETGRRERGRASGFIVEAARQSIEAAEILGRASRIAWEQRIAQVASSPTVDADPARAVAKLRALLDLFARQGGDR